MSSTLESHAAPYTDNENGKNGNRETTTTGNYKSDATTAPITEREDVEDYDETSSGLGESTDSDANNDNNQARTTVDEEETEGKSVRRMRTNRSIERSYSLNDGYSCHVGDEQSAEKKDDEEKGTGEEQSPEFVVGFDENDPMNPRNMSMGRRWLIVVICSTGSLCVYVLWP